MAEPENYVDHCVAATASIDIDALSRLEAGGEISRSDNISMRRLAGLSVLGAEVYSGLKVSKRGGDYVTSRLQKELEAVELLLSRMPEHAAKVPQFMTLLAIEGREAPIAILTEDVTQGGALPIYGLGSLLAPSDRAHAIKKAFRRVDGTEVNRSAIDHSLAFRVGDEERFLDFTPAPVKRTGSGHPAAERIIELILDDKLTVTVGAESPLSRSLAAAA